MPRTHRKHHSVKKTVVKKQIVTKPVKKSALTVKPTVGTIGTPIHWPPRNPQEAYFIGGMAFLMCILFAVTLALLSSSSRAAAREKADARDREARKVLDARGGKTGKDWDDAFAFREHAELQEHRAESAVRILAAQERVAHASTNCLVPFCRGVDHA